MILVTRPDGGFCDVVPLPGGGVAFVYVTRSAVVIERYRADGSLASTWSTSAPHTPGEYLRAGVSPAGLVVAGYQGQNGILYIVIEGDTARDYRLCFGGHPVCFSWNSGFVATVKRTGKTIERMALPSGLAIATITLAVGTSQGLLDLAPDGTPLGYDANRTQVVHGMTFSEPNTRGPVTVGQFSGGIAAATADGWWPILPAANAYEPHVAVDGTTVWACARTDHGATLARTPAPYPLRTTVPVASLPPMLEGCFFGELGGRYKVTRRAPGNCAVINESGLKPIAPRLIIARVSDEGVDLLGEYKDRWARVAAVYVAAEAAGTQASLETAIAAARTRMDALHLERRQVLAYTGGNVWPDLTADLLAVQCYIEPGEAVNVAEHRWRNVLQSYARRDVVLVCETFDRLKTVDVERLAAAILRYPEIARATPGCRGLLFFSWARAGGLLEYPALIPQATLALGAAGVPPIPAVEPQMTEPKITVKAFAPVKDNAPFTTLELGNGIVLRQWFEDAGWKSEVSLNGKVTDTTVVFRKAL